MNNGRGQKSEVANLSISKSLDDLQVNDKNLDKYYSAIILTESSEGATKALKSRGDK